jgi:predicted HTH domain antitoxin
MAIELPDQPATAQFSADELRLELACALYARGRVGKVTGSQLAGVDIFTFQRALGERQIPQYTDKMLAEDLATMEKLFPS